jgi:hypothetical protein
MLNATEIKAINEKPSMSTEDAMSLVNDMLDYTASLDSSKTEKCSSIKASFFLWNCSDNFSQPGCNWASYTGDRTGKAILAHAMKLGFSF